MGEPKLAGFWERAFAGVADVFILYTPYIVVYGFLFGFPQDITGRYDIIIFFLMTLVAFDFYDIFMQYRYGWTLGKRLLRIKLMSDDYSPPTLKQVLKRFLCLSWPGVVSRIWLLATIKAVPELWGNFTYCYMFLSCLIVLFDKRKRALHDIMAGTIVVRMNRRPPPSSNCPDETMTSAERY